MRSKGRRRHGKAWGWPWNRGPVEQRSDADLLRECQEQLRVMEAAEADTHEGWVRHVANIQNNAREADEERQQLYETIIKAAETITLLQQQLTEARVMIQALNSQLAQKKANSDNNEQWQELAGVQRRELDILYVTLRQLREALDGRRAAMGRG